MHKFCFEGLVEGECQCPDWRVARRKSLRSEDKRFDLEIIACVSLCFYGELSLGILGLDIKRDQSPVVVARAFSPSTLED